MLTNCALKMNLKFYVSASELLKLERLKDNGFYFFFFKDLFTIVWGEDELRNAFLADLSNEKG